MTKINNITLKNSENNQERMILGLIAEESSRIAYGTLTIEIMVRNGKMTHVDCFQPKRGLNLEISDKS